jgi:hypothetical protein
MAGWVPLGLFFHEGSALALAPRGLLRSAYGLSTEKGPGHREMAQGSFIRKKIWAPQRGFGDTTLYTKA